MPTRTDINKSASFASVNAALCIDSSGAGGRAAGVRGCQMGVERGGHPRRQQVAAARPGDVRRPWRRLVGG